MMTASDRTPSLRLALLIQVILPLVVAVGVSVFLALRAVEREVENRMQDEVELVARAIRLPVIHGLEREREGTVAQALESAFQIGRVYGAYLYDEEGALVAALGGEGVPGPGEDIPSEARDGERFGAYGQVEGRRVFSYFVPLTDQWGQNLGMLQVTRRRTDIEAHVRGVRIKAGGILLLGLLAGAILVLLGHRGTVGRALGQLRASMDRVERGDRGHRAEERGPSELREVARTFNRMLDSIARARAELERGREEERRLREELAVSERMAAVGRVSAGVAHELGSPLAVVDGEAQRLLRRPELSSESREGVGRIRADAARMERIVQQLLAVGGRGGGSERQVDLTGLLHRAVARAAREARAAGNANEPTPVEGGSRAPEDRLELEIPPELAVRGSPLRLELAAVNLVRNALEASASAPVRVALERDADTVTLIVEDGGPGVPTDLRERIFEPFFTTRPGEGGTGLGLAIVRSVAEEHGGDVEIAASPLGGASFRMRVSRG